MSKYSDGSKYIPCPCQDCRCVEYLWAKVPNHLCESCAAFEHEYDLGKLSAFVPSKDEYLAGYLEALFFFAPYDDDGNREGEGMDHTDLADEAKAKILGDITRFRRENDERIDAFLEAKNVSRLATLFLLDRNNSGSGFWDESPYGFWEDLSKASKEFGEQNLYKGDDGLLYVH